LNVTYKVFDIILYDLILLHAYAAVQLFQAGKSTTDQLFALRQILEKCNDITTLHLFIIDFKAAYDKIIRNEVYVGMSELNFPKKLLRLTKARYCDVLRQNTKRLFQIFETRQGLRQGDVLSIYAAFPCRAGSHCTTSKHNYSHMPMI
jgi:hypothetical protein